MVSRKIADKITVQKFNWIQGSMLSTTDFLLWFAGPNSLLNKKLWITGESTDIYIYDWKNKPEKLKIGNNIFINCLSVIAHKIPS